MDRKSFLGLGLGATLSIPLRGSQEWLPKHQVSSHQIPQADWKTLRSLFPLEKNRTFLNNGTMGITPYPVLEAVQKSYLHIAEKAAYPHHSDHLESELAQLLGVEAQEIGITKNVSEGVNHIAWGIDLQEGDEVILTQHEHIGGCAAWMRRAQLEKIKIKTVALGKNASETLDILKKAIGPKTKVMAVPHIPCTIGQVLPVKEICTLARERGIISVLDGAHPLGMIQFNLREIGCDYYAGCFHKWLLGPIGTGWMYIKKHRLNETKVTHVAAYSVNSFDMSQDPPEMALPNESASRYSYGTFGGPQLKGCEAALELYQQIGPGKIENRIRELHAYLRNTLLTKEDAVEILTPAENKSNAGQLGFRISPRYCSKEKPNSGFVAYARKNGLILRYVGENGIDCIRVSTHYYNQESEIDRFFELLKGYAWNE